MPGRWSVLPLLAVVLPASLARGDDAVPYVPPDFLTRTPPLPSTFDAQSAWRLELAEALQLAVRQNLGVALERKSAKIAELGVTVARGLFEPTLDASYLHDFSRTPPSTSQEGMAGEILEATGDRWR